MITKFILPVALISFFSFTAIAQDVVKCSSGKSFWVFPKDNKNYTVTLEEKGLITNSNKVLLNDTPLKYEIIELDVKNFSEDSAMNLLINHFSTMAANNREPGTTLESTFKKDHNGKPVLIVTGDTNHSKVHVCTVIDNKILSLSAQVQKLDNVIAITPSLENIIISATIIDKKENLCSK
mgnify:CR=1 FL=1